MEAVRHKDVVHSSLSVDSFRVDSHELFDPPRLTRKYGRRHLLFPLPAIFPLQLLHSTLWPLEVILDEIEEAQSDDLQGVLVERGLPVPSSLVARPTVTPMPCPWHREVFLLVHAPATRPAPLAQSCIPHVVKPLNEGIGEVHVESLDIFKVLAVEGWEPSRHRRPRGLLKESAREFFHACIRARAVSIA